MKVMCINDVVVNGISVYVSGEAYPYNEVNTNGEVTSFEIKSSYGVGVWSNDDPTFDKHFVKLDYKIFKFEQSEGTEIIAAGNAKEAIMYYFTEYQDDLQTDDMIEFGGIKIEEVKGEDLTKMHFVYNEHEYEHEGLSYEDLADACYSGEPTILVFPSY